MKTQKNNKNVLVNSEQEYIYTYIILKYKCKNISFLQQSC